jgi:Ran GTPase-activating protein (RanGAP) involved in mRNA processing and transport
MLHTNTTLKTLGLYHNRIGNEGATALAGMLHTNTTLKTLNLTGNTIGNEGATALAGMLHNNTTLESLRLDGYGNTIGADEKTALREAWGGRTTNLRL